MFLLMYAFMLTVMLTTNITLLYVQYLHMVIAVRNGYSPAAVGVGVTFNDTVFFSFDYSSIGSQ